MLRIHFFIQIFLLFQLNSFFFQLY